MNEVYHLSFHTIPLMVVKTEDFQGLVDSMMAVDVVMVGSNGFDIVGGRRGNFWMASTLGALWASMYEFFNYVI